MHSSDTLSRHRTKPMASQATPFDRPPLAATIPVPWVGSIGGRVVTVAAVIVAFVSALSLPVPWLDVVPGGLLILAGALIVATRAVPGRSEAAAWGLVGLAALVLGLGRVVAARLALGAPAQIDATIAAFHGLVVVGLLRLPYLRASVFGRLRIRFDAAAGVAAVLVLLNRFVPGLPFAGMLLTATVTGAVMVVSLRQSRYVDDRRLVTLVAAVTAGASLPILMSSGVGAGVLHTAESVAASLFGLLPWMLVRPQDRSRQIIARPARLGLLVPYVPAVAVAAVVGSTLVRGEALPATLGAGAVAVMTALIGRTWATVREYRRLVELERDQLLASMSHELRTPLTAVAGFAEVLTASWDRLPAEEAKDMSAIIYRQSKRLVDLVSDMAALARAELDTVSVDPRPVDGKVLVRRALMDVFEGDLSGWRVRAEVEPYVKVMADPRRLRQMVGALVENAKTYGGGSITIVIRRDGTARLIEVHDDGPGVASRHEEAIWGRFERGAHQLDAAIPGAGLGLARVRDLALAHAGEAGYRESERLGGACFTIRLPYEDLLAPRYLELRRQAGG